MDKPFRIMAATGTHRGDRDYQQDRVELLSHSRVNGCVLAIVADGMGGRSGGRKASDQVLMTASQLFERYDPHTDNAPVFLQNLVQEAHLVIRLTAISAEQEPHSTIAAFIINPEGDCHWIHAGDSRIYHFRRKKLLHRTRDHSYVQALVDRGELTEEQARDHPHSNILLGCLGMDADPPATCYSIPQLAVGETLLACSDGVWHYFTSKELAAATASLTPREASEYLIQEARERAEGGGDNLSLVVVRIEALVEERKATRFSGFEAKA
ncbi:PP2C family protein-serine/threonine phosphatase [Comamonas flocculans]|uniref:Serine/threonine-protein phosphatase n=1 Tax=Comamonas flocculans TaxID=2597701 RepID=A0A5B8RYB1_9BURK|nr:protein phosphatase 2C domain-containing protein [Comamonas flocculans]QEA13582.1 serine/threonine-protein phosphatase [Comamonas flocculans]